MEPAVLTRKKFSPREELVLANRSLLARASEVLGYRAAVLTSEESEIEYRKAELEVQSAFESLEIEPLDMKSVERYKAAKTKEVERKGSCALVKTMHKSDPGEQIVLFLGINPAQNNFLPSVAKRENVKEQSLARATDL